VLKYQDLPPLPPDPIQRTRKEGARYAQRLLRFLDTAFPQLSERLEGLKWAVEEMQLAHAAQKEMGSESFFEGVQSALGAAGSALRARLIKVTNLRAVASQCSQKAEKERARLLQAATVKRAEAEELEALASREFDRLSVYAAQQEGAAREAEVWTMADGRFA
jgi:hypothetical protein